MCIYREYSHVDRRGHVGGYKYETVGANSTPKNNFNTALVNQTLPGFGYFNTQSRVKPGLQEQAT